MIPLWIIHAGVMELADVTDSKSVDGDIVWVRVPPPAPKIPNILRRGIFGIFRCRGWGKEVSLQTASKFIISTVSVQVDADGERSEARRGSESHHRHQKYRIYSAGVYSVFFVVGDGASPSPAELVVIHF